MDSYKYIINPKTRNKVIINSKLGKEILSKYLNYINTTSAQRGGGEEEKWDNMFGMLKKDIEYILQAHEVEGEIIDGLQVGGGGKSDYPIPMIFHIEGPGYTIQGGDIISTTKEGWERGREALEKLREAATRDTKTPGSKDGEIWTPSKNPGDKLGLARNNYSPWTIGMVLTNILYGFEKASRGNHPRRKFRDAVNPGHTYYETRGPRWVI